MIWLLGLQRTDSQPTERGLVLVQIDGLSRKQLADALKQGRMPFLHSLLTKEHYVNHDFYSGLPSSTPAVQAELYYGDRTVVPAFGFRDHRTGRLVRMFANDIAADVENQLSADTTGLLFEGSSYCNIYGGGAEEVHFCATSFGWSEVLNKVNPVKLVMVAVLNFWMFFRVLGLMSIEFFLATFGFFRGIFSGRQFWQELIMIPARVVVVVMLRELVTIGACYDSARGQPVIHLNLLGYDEQAHRRGPSSRFAHWTLHGIDNSIRKIWRAAHRGAGREYDFWIFSDHGQEATRPYQLKHQKSIQQVVAEMVDNGSSAPSSDAARKPERLPTRADWLGIGWLVSMLFGEQDHDIQTRSDRVQTVTSGPMGFIHFLDESARTRRHEYARRLVQEADVPMAFVSDFEAGINVVKVYTLEGEFVLPGDAVTVFGPNHPFLDDLTEDMIRLVEHPDSGDIVITGWDPTQESTSFVLQNGAHAGPGVDETHGFALLPADTQLPSSVKRYIRPNDLRLAALRFLGRDSQGNEPKVYQKEPGAPVRVLTYNVHACVGMDGQLSPDRVARVIAQSGADIICLQELDVFRKRSGNRDQAHAIAESLSMRHQFHPAWHIEQEQFGNAILTRFPMRVVKAEPLHHHKEDRSRRSALWVEVDIDEHRSIQIINTHLSIYPTEQRIQARQLDEEWVQPAKLLGPVVLCGDLNARPNSTTCKTLRRSLLDVESFDSNPTHPTLFSPFPLTRVDHIFVSEDLKSSSNQVLQSRLAKIASDHLPLMSSLKFALADSESEPSTDQAMASS